MIFEHQNEVMIAKRYLKLFASLPVLLLLAAAMGCGTTQKAGSAEKEVAFYRVGHRGTRGLMPENTIPSFKKALEDGANTIEFDVHITRDSQVVIYHDASFNPDYTTMPDGSDIPKAARNRYTFYQMDYADIRKFIIGEKPYPAFPQQQRLKTYAPLMTEMIDSIEAFTRHSRKAPAIYLLEIKSGASSDGREQPDPETYMRIMMAALKPYLKALSGRLIIQSFDMRPLQILHRDYPAIPLGFLTGDKKATLDGNLQALGFDPAFYNPEFHLVNPGFLQQCHARGMKVLPWTVEELEDMARLKDMGVDGIITDYPIRL